MNLTRKDRYNSVTMRWFAKPRKPGSHNVEICPGQSSPVH